MNHLKMTCLLLSAAAMISCGKNATTDAIQDNAPTYANAALDMESGDNAEPSNESSAAIVPGDGTCHPYLFARTRNVVKRLNWHLFKTLFVMDHVLAERPSAQSGATATWTRQGLKYTFQAIGTKVSDTEFSYEISVKQNGQSDSAFVKVTSIDLNIAGASDAGSGPATQTGTMHFDFSAYSSVVTEDTSQGTLDYSFSLSSTQHTVEVTLAGFLPDDLIPEISPRNAHYVFTRTLGVGGSLKYTDELILACPRIGTPPVANTLARSSVDTVFRWTHLADGSFVARGDTVATSDSADTNAPNIPSGDKIEGVTCGTLGNGDVEKFWMMKLENGSGDTDVSGVFTYDSNPTVTDPTTACDAAFGTIPDTSDPTSDFDFGSYDFTSSAPASFPAQG